MSAQPIIIDTDPGQDDAVALLLALASPAELDVVGITTVAGNVPLELTSRNARTVCELAGRTDVPVYAGCAEPLVRPLVTATHVHGKTGLDGAELPAPVMPIPREHAVDFIIRTLRETDPATVTLCTLGPLTNLATAMTTAPDIVPRIRRIVMMGGGFFEGGNATPAAEFNIYVDPHAAHTVFSSGADLTLLPLDVTHQALATSERVERFRRLGHPIGTAVAGWLDFFDRYDSAKYGTDGAPLHDPTVIAYLLRPEIFGGKPCTVAIETESELTMGMTVIDWWDVTPEPANCMVIRTIDDDAFFALLVARIGTLGTRA